MKTKFTIIVILSIIAIATSAKGRESNVGKFHPFNMKQALVKKDINNVQIKHFLVTESFLSVPGFSEDYSWDEEANDWVHVTNTTYSYDEAGRVTEEIVQDAETDIYLTRISYAYDLLGNITEEVSYVMGFDEWTPVSGDKSVYTVSAESQINGVIEQSIENGIWVNKTKIEYILDVNNVPIGLQTYNWNGTDWALYSKTMNISWADWDTRKLAGYTEMFWQNQNWVNAERYTTQYDGENYIATTEKWVNVEWVNSTRETYSRTSFEEELILENWTETGWEKTEKYQGTFDAYGNPTGMFYSAWYDTSWELEMELFFDLLYNESNDVTEMVFRFRDQDMEDPMNTTMFRFSSFLHIVTDVPDINTLNDVKVYPNPASNSFSIQMDESQSMNYQVNIVNLAGQTVYSQNYTDRLILINAEQFVSGMYLLFIKTDDGKTYNSKLLKN